MIVDIPAFPKTPPLTPQLTRPTQQNVSGWTGKMQVLDSGRGWWTCTIEPTMIDGKDIFRPWGVFLDAVSTPENSFMLPVDTEAQWEPASTPSIRAKGAGQTGKTLLTDGWPVSTNGVLLAGDFFTMDQQLFRLTVDVDTNASGEATLQFEPNMRVSPADNSLLETVNPWMMAYCTEAPTYSIVHGRKYYISPLKLREWF